MAVAYAVRARKALNSLVNGQENTQVGHTVGNVSNVPYGLWQPGTNLYKVGLCGAEDRYRTPWFLTVIVQIGIVFGAVVVETKGISKFLYSDMTAVGRSKDGEIIDVDILLQRRSEQLLQAPYTCIIIGMVGNIVFRVGRMKVKRSFLRVPEGVLFSKAEQVFIG